MWALPFFCPTEADKKISAYVGSALFLNYAYVGGALFLNYAYVGALFFFEWWTTGEYVL
jgi:hypothetical protein